MEFDTNELPSGEEMIQDAIAENNGMASLLIAAINENWAIIQQYNDILVNATNDKISSILDGIIKDCYNHIGQLQAALDIVTPHVEEIDDGKE